jgi:hypothetical protein
MIGLSLPEWSKRINQPVLKHLPLPLMAPKGPYALEESDIDLMCASLRLVHLCHSKWLSIFNKQQKTVIAPFGNGARNQVPHRCGRPLQNRLPTKIFDLFGLFHTASGTFPLGSLIHPHVYREAWLC